MIFLNFLIHKILKKSQTALFQINHFLCKLFLLIVLDMLYDVRIEVYIYLLTDIIIYVTQRFIEVNGDDAIHNILPQEGSKNP